MRSGGGGNSSIVACVCTKIKRRNVDIEATRDLGKSPPLRQQYRRGVTALPRAKLLFI